MFKQVMPNVNDVMKQNPTWFRTYECGTTTWRWSSSVPLPPGERHEMEFGPHFDPMGGIPSASSAPISTSTLTAPSSQPCEDDDDDISDIVSVGGEGAEDDSGQGGEGPRGEGKRGRKKVKSL